MSLMGYESAAMQERDAAEHILGLELAETRQLVENEVPE
jgi:hypothetical protein